MAELNPFKIAQAQLAEAATIMDLLSAIKPKAVLFLGKCGGLKKKNQLGDLILPIAESNGDLTVVMANPRDHFALKALSMASGKRILPQVGIASSWNEVTPCNMTLRKLAEHAKVGVREAGGFPLEFGTITVSDGISMGHEGMRASLVSREVIADSVETVGGCQAFDGVVAIGGEAGPGLVGRLGEVAEQRQRRDAQPEAAPVAMPPGVHRRIPGAVVRRAAG